MGILGSLFSGITGGDIFKGILGGLGGYSEAKMSKEMAKLQGEYALKNTKLQAEEGRRTSEFEARLTDYLRQIDKERSRDALSNFSQFSSLGDNYQQAYAPERVGAMPTADAFNQGGGSQGGVGMGGQEPLINNFNRNRMNQPRV